MECNAVSELNADVDGRGMSSVRDMSNGRSVSIVSTSGAGASGESKGKVRLCS